MTRTFVLTYDEVPKSLNAGGTGSRRHWSVGHKEKKRWEGIWAMLLMVERAPRGMSMVRVEAVIEVADNRKRDSENFRSAISKPLADALVSGGWLADDTDEFFRFDGVRIRNGVELPPGPLRDRRNVVGRTVVTIEAEYEEGERPSGLSFDRTQVGA